MASKGNVNKRESKQGNNSKSKSKRSKSHQHGSSEEENRRTTSDQFGVWSTVTRVFLAFLVVVLIILIIVDLIGCMRHNSPCNVFTWIMDLMCLLTLFYGLWGIYAEAFCVIGGLVMELFAWALFALFASETIGGLLAFFTCFIAGIYAWMIWRSGLPLTGAPLCCCCLCIC